MTDLRKPNAALSGRPRSRHRALGWLVAALWVAGWSFTAHADPRNGAGARTDEPATATQHPPGLPLAQYRQLPGSKALAVVAGAPELGMGMAHSQSQDDTAALLALRACERQRQDTPRPCELVWLNDEAITTAAAIRASRPAEPHPLYLWRYRQGATTVYLAGSIHVLKASLMPLPPQFDAAFAAADHLVLEVDTQAVPPAQMQSLTLEYGVLDDGVTLSSLLDAQLNGRLNAALGRYGMAPAMVQKLKPALLMTQLVVARMSALGYLPDQGLESYFLGQAQGRTILQLESLEAQLNLLFNQPMATQIELLEDTLDQEAEIEPMMAAMLGAWLSGDDAEFLRLFELQQGDSAAAQAFLKALLDDRNVGMADGIAALLERPGSYFVLVGAAHFIGDQGIIGLLADRGIRGQRIYSNTDPETL
jgi:uncharacterized protein YbaP (TraB family)